MGLLDGKAAVVTGAGRGLGRAHALALAAQGASVLVNDVGGEVEGGGADPGVAERVAAEIRGAGGRAEADPSDVSTLAGAGAVVERALAAFGRLDVLVNNAGVSRLATVEELDEPLLDLHLGVHLKGTVGTTKAAFPAMRQAGGGRIVNTVSGAGLNPEWPGTCAYACAKAAVYAFTKVAAIEGAPHGIRVNAIAPLAHTRMSEAFFARTRPGAADRFDPSRVSVAVVFLASDLSGDLTGRVLRVEGRRLAEAFFDRTDGVDLAEGTPQEIAARLGEILRA